MNPWSPAIQLWLPTIHPLREGYHHNSLYERASRARVQASASWKGKYFIGWSIWKRREICHFSLLKENTKAKGYLFRQKSYIKR